jgi:1,2-diacylglycerol 3-alpha-glucosyltransferase
MKNFNILTITPFFPPDRGGLSYHVLNLNTNLINSGNSVSTIATKHLGEKISEVNIGSKSTIRISSFYPPGWPYPTLRSFSIPFDLGKKIDSIIKNGNFDIVHAHGHHYPTSWFAIKSAKKHGIPSVLTLHGMYALDPNVLGGRSKLEDYFNRWVFKKYITKTKAIIGLTDQITNYAKLY